MSKIHYFDRFGHDVTKSNQRFDICACGLSGTIHQTSIEIEDVTCDSCKETRKFKGAVQAIESKRELSEEEFKEPKKTMFDCLDNGFQREKTQLEIDTEKYNLNDEQVEYLSGFDYEIVKSNGSCKNCLFSYSKTDVTCGNIECDMVNSQFIFKQIHKTQESLNDSIEKEELKEIETPFEEPVKLEEFKLAGDTLRFDTKKVSRIFDENDNMINDNMIWVKHPEYDPEDVAFDNSCPEVLLTGEDAIRYIEQQNEESHIKSILEDDTTKEPKPSYKQQSSHYQNGVETIEKIEMILNNLNDKITPFQGYLLGNVLKYSDRLGLKDDKIKDAYKASDYANKLLNEGWIHETE